MNCHLLIISLKSYQVQTPQILGLTRTTHTGHWKANHHSSDFILLCFRIVC